MKKILSIIFFGVTLFSTMSCKNEEDLLFDKSAAERLNEASAVYSQRVLSSPNGWILEYFAHPETDEDKPVVGAGFLLLTKFDADKSVLVAMSNYLTADNYKEDRSAWEVITDNGPVLSFNSHNDCLHAFSIPEDIPGTSENETGKGFEGDYEFVMVDVPEGANYITLKGKKRGAYSRLTKLDEETNFEEYITDVKKFASLHFAHKAPNSFNMSIGGMTYDVIMAQDGGQYGVTKIWPAGTDSTFTKEVHPLIVSRHGVKDAYKYSVRFRDPIAVREDVSEQEFVYDAASQKFVGVTSSNNVIEGPDATKFVADKLGNMSALPFISGIEASDDITNELNAVRTAFTRVSYTFNNIRIRKNGDSYIAAVAYRNNKKQNVTTNFDFNVEYTDEGKLALQYAGASTSGAQALVNAIPALASFFNTISKSYTVMPYDSPLNLTTVKFVSGDQYFVTSPAY